MRKLKTLPVRKPPLDEHRLRVRLFSAIILVVLGLLGVRLAWLQLVDAREFRDTSRQNAIRERRVQPARGALYDRAGTLLVDNEPTYTITLTPRYFDASKTGLLAELLDVPDSLVAAELAEAKRWSPFKPSRSFREVSPEALGRVVENLYLLPGVAYEVEHKRRYHAPARAAHAVGYVREIAARELERRREEGYRPGDLVGKTGLERTYEEALRGELGRELKLVNVHGLEVTSFRDGAEDSPPTSGYDLHLTLDARVQALAESLFVNKRGGAVALDPNTGELLALVSHPDFDPALFSQTVDRETWAYLNESPERPMYNRATQSMQPPGSTWKPLMALLALEEGVISPDTRLYCGGGHPLGRGRSLRCMHVHGSIGIEEAIQESCNTFFFELMMRTDVETLRRYAHRFGFGVRAETDVGEQAPGLIPDSAYFDRLAPRGWGPGWTISLGIGQGNMGATPFELAQFTAVVGAGGLKHPPHLVRELRHAETGEVVRPDLPEPERLPIDRRFFEIVRDGMRRVMERGTGRGVQIPGIPSGGKTGTAQAGPGREDNSVFILFAPYDDPQIAVAVQVENAGYGSVAAGPIASLMAELYLTGEIAEERRWLVERTLGVESEPLRDWRFSSDE